MSAPRGVLPADVVWLTPNVFTEPFWLATAEHRLTLPRCTSCGTYRFPPSAFCFHCRAQDVEWVEHDGNGTLYSFTIIRHAVIPDVADSLPLVAGVVELPGTGGVRLVANIVDTDVDRVVIGAPAELVWYDVREGTTIPCFRLP